MQVGLTQATVGVVTVGAGGFALGDGVSGGQAQLRAYLLVAIEADLLRLQASGVQITLTVQVVAAIAAEVFLLVLAAAPKHLIAFFMTALATGAARVGVCRPAWAEAHIRRGVGGRVQVALAGSVTGATAGVAATGQIPVYGVVYSVYGHVGTGCMTIQALCLARLCLAIFCRGTAHKTQGAACHI